MFAKAVGAAVCNFAESVDCNFLGGRERRLYSMAIGALPDISIGQLFNSRRELYEAGVHRAREAGIVGRSEVGAESMVLSGGYADDEDYGEIIILHWGRRQRPQFRPTSGPPGLHSSKPSSSDKRAARAPSPCRAGFRTREPFFPS